MTKISKNLGLVSAIHIGTSNPSNIYQIWYNLGDGLHYYYNTSTLTWIPLSSAVGGATLEETLGNGPYTNGSDIKISTASGDSIVYVNAAGTKSISLFANPTLGNFTQTYQDKSGTIALLSDINNTNIYNSNGTIGTGRITTITDTIDFNGGQFRTQNGYWQGTAKILYINPNSTFDCLFVGQNSGNNTMTGDQNTGVGKYALGVNTTGSQNTAIGWKTLENTTTGYVNTAIGSTALQFNTTGWGNIAIGTAALQFNTIALGNIAIGRSVLQFNTTANFNIGIGDLALNSNTTGNTNVAIGANSLTTNTTGVANTSIANNTLLSNTTGSYNIAIGYGASQYGTTASFNSVIGRHALLTNITGSENTVIGYAAMDSCGSNVNRNTAIGNNSLRYTTSDYNVAIGFDSALNNTSGGKNTAIGYQSFYTNTVGSSNVALGAYAGYYETGSNKLFIDNAQRASEADGREKALVYGIFDAAVANQRLNINASVGIGGGIANGTSVLNIANLPTSAVGLVTGDVWNNLGILTIV